MAIWAIADLHLSFGVPDKKMDVFGPEWKDHAEKIELAWKESISPQDLILIPGDISWAMRPEEARPDLEWIGQLPGTKVFLKGNHDYWWGSLSKVKQILPSSCHVIQNNSFNWQDVSIAGTRLWDVPGLNFADVIDFKENNRAKALTAFDQSEELEKVYQRELGRLEMSLQTLNPQAKLKIAMTHYPPIGLDLQDSEVSKLLEKYQIQVCVFGHLHSLKPGLSLFGSHNGIQYVLASCDYLNFKPIKIRD